MTTAATVLLDPNPHAAAESQAITLYLTLERDGRVYEFADGSRLGEIDSVGQPELVAQEPLDPSVWLGIPSTHRYDLY